MPRTKYHVECSAGYDVLARKMDLGFNTHSTPSLQHAQAHCVYLPPEYQNSPAQGSDSCRSNFTYKNSHPTIQTPYRGNKLHLTPVPPHFFHKPWNLALQPGSYHKKIFTRIVKEPVGISHKSLENSITLSTRTQNARPTKTGS